MKQTTKEWLKFIALILIVQVCLSYILVEVYSTSYHECYSNPMVYGIKEIEEQWDFDTLQCTCSGGSASFHINRTGFSENNTPMTYTNPYNQDNINYTKLLEDFPLE